MTALRRTAAILVLMAALSAPGQSQAASCRGYGKEVQAAIKRHVEALRMIEREAADRVVGLDTRPYGFLLKEARTTMDLIADKHGLAAEDELSRCRNYIPPVRRTCAGAAQALVQLIAEQAAGAATKATKQVYAQAMPKCERWMDLAPLKTAFRSLD